MSCTAALKKRFQPGVKVRADFHEDEIFQLADSYNRNWLPLKAKEIEQELTKTPAPVAG